MLGSSNPQDWIKISEMLIGPVPEVILRSFLPFFSSNATQGFVFQPKHQSNSYGSESAAVTPADNSPLIPNNITE